MRLNTVYKRLYMIIFFIAFFVTTPELVVHAQVEPWLLADSKLSGYRPVVRANNPSAEALINQNINDYIYEQFCS